MKKRLLTVCLSVAMVITMAVPSFAGTVCKKPIYVVIGDSISAGYNQSFGGLGYDDDKYDNYVRPYGRGREVGPDGIDTRAIDFIKKAYPALVARKLGGIDEENSYNFSYPGYRAKDFCFALGLLNAKEKADFANDHYLQNYVDFGQSDNDESYGRTSVESLLESGAQAKAAIKKASVINIQLGSNELTSCFSDIKAVIPQLMEMICKDLGINTSLSLESIKDADLTFTEETILGAMLEAVRTINSNANCKAKNRAVITVLCGAGLICKDAIKSVKAIDDVFDQHVQDAQKYLNRLVSYCRKANPSASIVILSTFNPIRDAFDGFDPSARNPLLDMMLSDVSFDIFSLDIDFTKIDDILSVVVQPVVNRINKNIDTIANKYRCMLADVSSIKPGSMDKWFMHPTREGHEEIAEIIIKAIEQDCKKRGYKLTAYSIAKNDCKEKRGCEHGRTETINLKDATLLQDGYTGDIGCMICGDILSTGEVIPQLKIEGTAISKLTGKKKSVTAEWNTVADIDGYQIQISTSKSFTKNKKKATVNDATATARKINKLKAGTKYYVRVRTIKKVDEANTVYSAWSATKSVKTQ